jgi:hypothetical protein
MASVATNLNFVSIGGAGFYTGFLPENTCTLPARATADRFTSTSAIPNSHKRLNSEPV